MHIYRPLLTLVLLVPSLHAATHLQQSHAPTIIRHPGPTLASYRIHTTAAAHTHTEALNALGTANNAPSHTTVLAYLIHLIEGFCRRMTT